VFAAEEEEGLRRKGRQLWNGREQSKPVRVRTRNESEGCSLAGVGEARDWSGQSKNEATKGEFR